MGNYNIVGDHLLIANYVRYERLTELINAEFVNSNAEEVNLYIDMYSMIKSIYGLDPDQFIDEYSIASCIINACAHYRNFFWTRYRVTCKIWIIFSRMEMSIKEARAFCTSYGNIFTMGRNPSMDAFIDINVNILESLCPYIYDVQFVYSLYEPGLVMGKIISSKDNIFTPIPNIIITKDMWPLQLVSNFPNTYILRPYKRNSEDMSTLVSCNNAIVYYLYARKTKETFLNIPPFEYLQFIMASTRFPERGLKSLIPVGTIIKQINSGIDKSIIPKSGMIYDVRSLCNDIGIKPNITSQIELRMEAMGFNRCFYRYITGPAVDNIDIVNLHDPDSVKRINERYFSKVPLDLMSL